MGSADTSLCFMSSVKKDLRQAVLRRPPPPPRASSELVDSGAGGSAQAGTASPNAHEGLFTMTDGVRHGG